MLICLHRSGFISIDCDRSTVESLSVLTIHPFSINHHELAFSTYSRIDFLKTLMSTLSKDQSREMFCLVCFFHHFTNTLYCFCIHQDPHRLWSQAYRSSSPSKRCLFLTTFPVKCSFYSMFRRFLPKMQHNQHNKTLGRRRK